jgi:hypothetical protein
MVIEIDEGNYICEISFSYCPLILSYQRRSRLCLFDIEHIAIDLMVVIVAVTLVHFTSCENEILQHTGSHSIGTSYL